MKIKTHRDQEWLENMLADIWLRHFDDVPQSNEVVVRWGRKAKRRLGSISLDPNNESTSIITINSLFQDPDVPEYVIKATIVHEMTHYAHGFNSPIEQKKLHPHSGGVIRKEFTDRDLEDLYVLQKKWLKASWSAIISKYYQPKIRYTVVKNTTKKIPSPWWMRGL